MNEIEKKQNALETLVYSYLEDTQASTKLAQDSSLLFHFTDGSVPWFFLGFQTSPRHNPVIWLSR